MRFARFGGAVGGGFLQKRGARDDDAAAVIGELRDAELDRLVDERVGILDLAESDLRKRAERAEPGNVHLEAAFVAAGDLAFHGQTVLVCDAELIERCTSLDQLAGDSHLGAGLDDRGFDGIADIESFQLSRVHHGFGRTAVGNVGVIAGDRNDRASKQLALLRGFEIQSLHRLGERRSLGCLSRLNHGSVCYLSGDWFSVARTVGTRILLEEWSAVTTGCVKNRALPGKIFKTVKMGSRWSVSVVGCQLSVVGCQLSVVGCQLSVVWE